MKTDMYISCFRLQKLDEYGLLIRSSGGFSKPNHLYMRIPCIELISEPDVKQTDENKTSIGMKSCPSFSRKTASSMVGIVPPSKVKEKYVKINGKSFDFCHFL